MAKNKLKIKFDEEDRKQFLLQSKRGKYTKKQKLEYQKKLQISENRKNKKEKDRIFKERVEEKFKELNERLNKINEEYSCGEEED